MSAEWGLQKAIRAALVAAPAVVAAVPAGSIVDTVRHPAPVPGIVLGEAVTVPKAGALIRGRKTVAMPVHIWIEGPDTAAIKAVTAAAWDALAGLRQRLDALYVLSDMAVLSCRILKDPDGKTLHAVLQVEAAVARA